jgi:hypothetical protein
LTPSFPAETSFLMARKQAIRVPSDPEDQSSRRVCSKGKRSSTRQIVRWLRHSSAGPSVEGRLRTKRITHLDIHPDRFGCSTDPGDHLGALGEADPEETARSSVVRKLGDEVKKVGDIREKHLHERGGRRLEELVSAGSGREPVGDVCGEEKGGVLQGGENELVEDWRRERRSSRSDRRKVEEET